MRLQFQQSCSWGSGLYSAHARQCLHAITSFIWKDTLDRFYALAQGYGWRECCRISVWLQRQLPLRAVPHTELQPDVAEYSHLSECTIESGIKNSA
jgi:hypothetical protein